MYTPEFFADPHPTYRKLREEAAVHRIQDPKGLTYWLITRFDEAKAALADPCLAKDPRHAWEALRAAGMVSGDPAEATFDLHTTDPPRHTRLRALVTRAFTTKGKLLRVVEQGSEAVADEVHDRFVPGEEQLLRERDDLDRLQPACPQRADQVIPFLFGGNEIHDVVAEPAAAFLIAGAVDELLRYDGPTARASPRYPTEDIEIAGTVIPAGSVVIVGIASANRDPRRFDDPDRLDITRPEQPHLAFGHGIHRCLGVALARLEGEIAIGTLLRQRPSVRLDGELTWHPFPVFRGLRTLPVRFA